MAANPMTCKLGIILVFILAVPAIAQPGIDADFMWSPSISQAEFEQCVDSLALSNDSDEAIFKTLYVKLLSDYHHHSALVKHRLKEIDAGQAAYRAANPDTPRVHKGLAMANHEAQFAWKTLRKKLDAQFDNDVRLSLTLKQQENWKSVVQNSRRRRILPEVRQLGLVRSTADVVSIIEIIDLASSDRDFIEPILSEYVDAMDEALNSWENEADVLQSQIMSIAYGPSGSEQNTREQQQQLRKQIEGLAANVSDLNHQYVARIEALLSDQYAQSFIEEISKVEYPDLFLPSPVDLIANMIDETTQISKEQQKGINAVYEAYILKRAEIRRRIIKGIYQWEHPRKRDLEKRHIAYKQYIKDGLDPYKAFEDHPAMPWLEKRLTLAKNTCAHLRSLFADDEFEALPMRLQLLLNW